LVTFRRRPMNFGRRFMGFRRLRVADRWHIVTPSFFAASLKTSVSGLRETYCFVPRANSVARFLMERNWRRRSLRSRASRPRRRATRSRPLALRSNTDEIDYMG
jgi:hypothetical protein